MIVEYDKYIRVMKEPSPQTENTVVNKEGLAL